MVSGSTLQGPPAPRPGYRGHTRVPLLRCCPPPTHLSEPAPAGPRKATCCPDVTYQMHTAPPWRDLGTTVNRPSGSSHRGHLPCGWLSPPNFGDPGSRVAGGLGPGTWWQREVLGTWATPGSQQPSSASTHKPPKDRSEPLEVDELLCFLTRAILNLSPVSASSGGSGSFPQTPRTSVSHGLL